ncbi:MAG TPA: ABC transporter permease [Spirochaetia bacterium]|nr:ABC transporter permease [Spirochaetia bacterium]
MLGYIGRRLLQIIPLLVLLSILIFAIIQLPPGDFVTKQVQTLKMQGTEVAQSQIDNLRNLYNLDKPMYLQYWFWIKNIVTKGDFGYSMAWNKPVTELIRERFATTFVVSILTLLLTWVVAIPIGIYSATHQYSPLDYLFTFIGFLGIAVPGFLIALVLLYLVFSKTGVAITGLFSQQYIDAPLSWGKIVDGAKHIWVPVLIIGLSGTGSLIRVTRNMLLDELSKQYVITARSKGVPEGRLLWKYPVRIAINPLISTIGWLLPAIISGEALVSIVLNMPSIGPLMLLAMLNQDMYLAGSFILVTSILTVFGTLISDILLAWFDPRIRFGTVRDGS